MQAAIARCYFEQYASYEFMWFSYFLIQFVCYVWHPDVTQKLSKDILWVKSNV